jgi:protein-disulfide isomerase
MEPIQEEKIVPTPKPQLNIPTAIIIAGILIAGAVFITRSPQSAPVGQQATPSAPQQPTTPADVSKVNITNEPFIGNPNAATTVAYWFDYQCPFCKQNEQTMMPQLIKDYVDTGKVKVIFKDYQFLSEDSQTLGKYGRAVWEVAPDKFYAWHKAIYDNQGKENTGWATQSVIVSLTTPILGTSNTAKVVQLVSTKGTLYQQEIDADKAEGSSFGINGTPGFIIGHKLIQGAVPYTQIKTAIDTAITGK